MNWVCFFSGQSSTTEQSNHNHSDSQAASDMVSTTEEEMPSEEENYVNSKPEIWLEIAGFELDQEMRRTILSDRGWLDDNVINAAQSLLKDQYGTAGLQKTTLGYHLQYDVMRREFVQVVYNGKNHWLTLSTIGLQESTATVNVYDSLYTSLSTSTKMQVCALLCTMNSSIDFRFIDADKQANTSDCGLYAIAYATSLCCGQDPCSIQYCQPKLRKHLVTCLEKGSITPYPCISKHSINSVISKETISVFCSCRMPEKGRMIECTKCKEWFHRQCAGLVPRKAWKSQECTWHCSRCK